MGVFGDFKMDEKKELEGVAVTFSENADKTVPTFHITRMSPNNIKYAKALERATRPIQRQIELKKLSVEQANKIQREVFVNSILLGWDHVQDENGAEIPYNGENALKLFEALPDLFTELQQAAQNAALFRADVQEQNAKN